MLVGTITSGMGRGPAETRSSFRPSSSQFLRVEPDTTDNRNQPEDGVSLVQLVISSTATMALYESLKDKPATVTGTLSHASAPGYHYTQVLITVKEIEPQPGVAVQ